MVTTDHPFLKILLVCTGCTTTLTYITQTNTTGPCDLHKVRTFAPITVIFSSAWNWHRAKKCLQESSLLAKKSKGSTKHLKYLSVNKNLSPRAAPKTSRGEWRCFSELFTTAMCKCAFNSAAPAPLFHSTYCVTISRTITALPLKNSSHYSILHQIFSPKTHMAPEKMFLHRYKTSTFKYVRTYTHAH